ncbi:MAG: AsmA family protein, partial [Mariprofundaceae bacterium]|nr:AsmA family protein [Mariprofundaceae bacterium]
MKKTAKKTVRYSLIGLALLVVLLIAAPFFIDANQYKSLIVDQAEKATGRQIEIGELKASLFPWVGVRIDGVKIANPRGFAEGDFLTVKSLDVQVALLPLLGGNYQIERFVLDTPKLQLQRAADGFSNWEDLLPSASTGVASAPSTSVSPRPSTGKATAPTPAAKDSKSIGGNGSILAALSAQSLRMSNGEVRYRDAQTGRDILLSKLNIEVDDVQMQRPIALRVSANLGGDDFALDGEIGPLGDLSAFDAARLPLKGHFSVPAASLANLREFIPELIAVGDGKIGVDVQVEQHPNGLRVLAGSLNLHTAHELAINLRAQMPDAQQLQIDNLKVQLDGVEVAELKGTLRGLGGKLRYEMRINTPELGHQQLAAWLPEIANMYALHPDPWKKIKLGMLIAGTSKQVDIRDLQLLLDGELVQVSGNIGFADALNKGPDIHLRIAARELHLDPWLPQPAAESAPDQSTMPGQTIAPNQPASEATPLSMLPGGKSLVLIPVAHAASPANAESGARINSLAASVGVEALQEAPVQEDTMVGVEEQKPVEPDLRFLKPWRLTAVVQVDRMLFRGLDMSRLRADVSSRKGIIRINPLRFEIAGGRVEEKASVNVGVYPVRWSESVKVREVQLQPVLMALADTDMLSGKLQMDTHLSGVGLLPDAALTRLNGKGNVLLRDGSIKGFDIAGALRNIKLLGKSGGENKKTYFSQLSGSFKIANGLVKNDDLFMASPLFRLTGYGVVNLVARNMDYHLKPRLVGTLVGQGDTQAVRKGLEVPLRLLGPLDAPQVKLEVSLKTLLGNKEAIQNIIKNRKSIFKNLLKG